jgi:hypothetical protein
MQMGLPSRNGTTIRHTSQITYITQNNISYSNKTQYTSNYGHTTHIEYNGNMINKYYH